MADVEFFVWRNNQNIGPFRRDQLTEKLLLGEFSDQDLVSRGGGPWMTIAQMVESEESSAAAPLSGFAPNPQPPSSSAYHSSMGSYPGAPPAVPMAPYPGAQPAAPMGGYPGGSVPPGAYAPPSIYAPQQMGYAPQQMGYAPQQMGYAPPTPPPPAYAPPQPAYAPPTPAPPVYQQPPSSANIPPYSAPQSVGHYGTPPLAVPPPPRATPQPQYAPSAPPAAPNAVEPSNIGGNNLPVIITAVVGSLVLVVLLVFVISGSGRKQVSDEPNPTVTPPVKPAKQPEEPSPTPEPKKEAVSPAIAASAEQAIGLVCISQKGLEGEWVLRPVGTAWAMGPRQFISRAYWLTELENQDLQQIGAKTGQPVLQVVTPNRVLKVTKLVFHPQFPSAKAALEEATIKKRLLYDVARLEVDQDIPAMLPVADNPQLENVSSEDRPVKVLSFETTGVTKPIGFRPNIAWMDANLKEHIMAPGGNPNLAGTRIQCRAQVDGSPLLDGAGRVVGMVSLEYDDENKVAGESHRVLPVTRAREVFNR